jgi:hypothetical protein
MVRPSLALARKRWRIRRREAGCSWRCILGEHPECKGHVGRLQSADIERPACQCKCHTEERDPWAA